MKVKLNIRSESYHTSCVITGFHMLEEKGEVKLEINDIRKSEPMTDAVIDAEIDGEKVVFDLADGYRYDEKEKVDKLFSGADVIFKRSYSESENCNLSDDICGKIKSFGLNWFVTYKNNPLTMRTPSVKGILKTIKLTDSYLSDFEAKTLKHNKHPKILFLTRLWDPNGDDIKNDQLLYDERVYINDMRTATVRLLKKEFGNMFFGGIYSDGFSEKFCPDLLVDKSVSLKRVYLHRMKKSDICVNTMGLHGSTGWKTAEYVAAARAIVSEKFIYRATGNFDNGRNYLEFTTPTECAEKVSILIDNEDMRLEMSERNKIYYENYLRPDAQVKRALEVLKEER